MNLLRVEPNTVFKWNSGMRLRARARTQVLLPGAILCDGEEIRSIFDISNDDVCISFQRNKSGSGFDLITIDLLAGDTMELNKPSEVVFRSNLNLLLEFEVVE